ncbi:hypothetical protein IFM89_039122 [Coptis chinensis]|nr:hypothetical protein IFM89_039122 [Coptis chinensis]
MDFVEPH